MFSVVSVRITCKWKTPCLFVDLQWRSVWCGWTPSAHRWGANQENLRRRRCLCWRYEWKHSCPVKPNARRFSTAPSLTRTAYTVAAASPSCHGHTLSQVRKSSMVMHHQGFFFFFFNPKVHLIVLVRNTEDHEVWFIRMAGQNFNHHSVNVFLFAVDSEMVEMTLALDTQSHTTKKKSEEKISVE